jgi:hypothetical protein
MKEVIKSDLVNYNYILPSRSIFPSCNADLRTDLTT